MARQLLTVSCVVMIGAIIILPEAHSKVFQTTYDAQREPAIPKRYYLQYRSYRDDHAVPEAAHCVSLLVMSNAFGLRSAILYYKPTLQGQMKHKQVKIRTHKAPGSRSVVDNMMRITDDETGRQLYDQTLQYTDYGTCRVLVEQFASSRHCSLWLSPERRRGSIPAACSQAYTDICRDRRHHIEDGRCP
uniref:Putative secreted salivary protein of the histamine binding family n=1 Tax=Ixodes scapularis TaxID=6945 RepID=Q4PMJ7_IXOSC|nr:putative secreted salivary protein of the histamine binding family [Ixodes scapularis]